MRRGDAKSAPAPPARVPREAPYTKRTPAEPASSREALRLDVEGYGLKVDSLKEAIELIMLSTLLDQLASFQLASAQLASFQLASAQLASLQLACAHEAPLWRYSPPLARSDDGERVVASWARHC